MRKFFSYDSKFMTFLRRIADLMILSVLWVVCSIPLATIGPATAALYFVTLKMVRHEETHILKMYMYSFRENLLQGIGITVLFAFCGFILILDYFMIVVMSGVFQVILKVAFLVMTLFFMFVLFYTFPLQAQFTNTIRQILKNAWLLSFQKLGNTVFVVVLNILPLMIFLIFTEVFLKTIPVWMLLAPAAIAYLCSKGFVKIFDSLIDSINS